MNTSIGSYDPFDDYLARMFISAVVFPVVSAVVGPVLAPIVTAVLLGGDGNGDGGAGSACA